MLLPGRQRRGPSRVARMSVTVGDTSASSRPARMLVDRPTTCPYLALKSTAQSLGSVTMLVCVSSIVESV